MAWPNGYTYRRSITVDDTKVSGSGDLSSFPMLVSGTHAYLATVANGGKVESASGFDIRFELADTTKLDHEVEKWVSTTGEFAAWVRIPTLDGDAPTVIYVYYGNASVVSTEEDVPGTWDSNYAAVWHSEASSGTTLADSTANGNDATKKGATEPNPATGKIDGAQDYDGVDDYAEVADDATLNTPQVTTFSVWLFIDGFATAFPWIASVFGDEPAGAGTAVWRLGSQGSEALKARIGINFNDGTDHDTESNSDLSTGAWVYVVVTTDGTNARFYIDAALDATKAYTITPTQKSQIWRIGTTAVGARPFNGLIDEVRLSYGIARSGDWISTEFANQDDPATFYAVGSEETSGGGGTEAGPLVNSQRLKGLTGGALAA